MLTAWAPDGLPEIVPGTDLAALIGASTELADGDIVAVTSKVVSKALGLVRSGNRDAALAEETVRVVARRGPTTIVRNRQGLTMAAAGIDGSNVPAGAIVPLPPDPDGEARRIRAGLSATANVGVLITDTAGRAWRTGQTDIAIGAAGVLVADDHAGRYDDHGNPLLVTMPAVADELAGTAELVATKLGRRPVVVIRGRADLVLPPGQDGPGAAALVRPDGEDLFGYGSREAVLRALTARPGELAPFGSPLPLVEFASALAELGVVAEPRGDGLAVAAEGRLAVLVEVLAAASGWDCESDGHAALRLRPHAP